METFDAINLIVKKEKSLISTFNICGEKKTKGPWKAEKREINKAPLPIFPVILHGNSRS